MAKFEFNKGAIDRVAREAVRNMAADLTRGLNALVATHEGRPVDEVKIAVQRVWKDRSGGGSISDPELTQFAEEIAAGRGVTVRAK
jgi:hypothetical protein